MFFMPQMSPMWWLNMMIMFIFCFLVLNSMIYFNFSLKNKMYLKFYSSKFIWKW